MILVFPRRCSFGLLVAGQEQGKAKALHDVYLQIRASSPSQDTCPNFSADDNDALP